MPVTWFNNNVEYSGAIDVNAASGALGVWLQGVLNYYRNGECDTVVQAHCGDFAQDAPRHLGEGLEPWWTYTVDARGTYIDDAPCPGDGTKTDVGSVYDANGVFMTYRTFVRVSLSGCNRTYKIERVNAAGTVYAVSGNHATEAAANAGLITEIQAEMYSGTWFHKERPQLSQWIAGNYKSWNAAPMPHSTVKSELRDILAEVYAELERSNFRQVLLAGSVWNPVPTEEQLNSTSADSDGDGIPDEDDPCPSDATNTCTPSDGGTVDPGNCEEGWFLTKVVCEIRNRVNETWQFLSHDAWVPQEDWNSRWALIKAEYDEKVIFGLGAADFGLPGRDDIQTMTVSTHEWCDFSIDVGKINPMSNENVIVEAEVRSGENWCESAPADWMSTVGRTILGWFFAATYAIKLYATVTERA